MIDLTVLLSIFDASEFFAWFVENANYWFVFIFMAIESSFIPFPSEVVIPPAAYLAVTNTGAGAEMNIYLVVLIATAGALVGAFFNYFIALWLGRPIVNAFANSRLGHACLIDQQKVDRAEAYFDKHGAISTFVGRLIPAIRQLISIPAGLAKMNIGVFAAFTALGAFVWNAILALLGYWLARNVEPDMLFQKVEEYNSYLTWAGYALFALCVIFIAYNAFKNKKKN